jgi:hypothetical protein
MGVTFQYPRHCQQKGEGVRVNDRFLKPDRPQPEPIPKEDDNELDDYDEEDKPRYRATDGSRDLIDPIREAEHEGL